jgi:hypothetical protein
VKRLLQLALLASCSRADARDPACTIVQPATPLPAVIRETSGVARSAAHPGIYWTHDDSGNDAELYAIRPSGERVATVEVTGAENRDWEDVALGPCPAGSCLYIADTGDNDAKHDDVSIYRVPEPALDAGRTAPAQRFRFRYPGGPRDVEALYVLPDGQVFVVSKGTTSSVALYRVPTPLREGETATAEQVAVFSARKPDVAGMVTAASASPSGQWVAIRTYGGLALYRAADLARGRLRPQQVVDLSGLGQLQGEAVALLDDGTVVLTAEGGKRQGPPTVAVVRCPLPTEEAP